MNRRYKDKLEEMLRGDLLRAEEELSRTPAKERAWALRQHQELLNCFSRLVICGVLPLGISSKPFGHTDPPDSPV